jgi:transposase InsO family protein
MLTFRTLYVLVFVSHARRQTVHLNVAAMSCRQIPAAVGLAVTPWGRTPRYLVRDRDAVYGRDFVPRARELGIETLLTPIRAPRANAVAERLIGTLRRECIDHLILINEAHLRSVLAEFMRSSTSSDRIELWISTRPSSGSGQQPVRSAATPSSAACTACTGELHDWRQTCAHTCSTAPDRSTRADTLVVRLCTDSHR